jgi:uncharacterized protein YbjT (DUF2867 family)
MKVVLPGGTGQIGALLARAFMSEGHEVVVLSRSGKSAARVVTWDGKTVEDAWAKEIDGADVVINLAGRTVNCRYTAAHLKEMMDSRIDSTRAVGAAIAAAARGATDPYLRPRSHWVIRRLGPRSDKLDIESLAEGDLGEVLRAMGREVANIHRGSPKAVPGIVRDLARRRAGWLLAAAETMAEATRADWKAWKKHKAANDG